MKPRVDHENNSHQKDDKLDDLVKKATTGDRRSFVRPSDETITAYLTGSADDSQTGEVLQACERSESFARELAQLAEDMEAAADEDTLSELAAAIHPKS